VRSLVFKEELKAKLRGEGSFSFIILKAKGGNGKSKQQRKHTREWGGKGGQDQSWALSSKSLDEDRREEMKRKKRNRGVQRKI